MAGEIKRRLEKLVEEVAKGNPLIRTTTKTKLIIKGLDPDKFSENTEDDPDVLKRVDEIAQEFNVQV